MEVWKEELYHHGILGMKWGIRRFQNKDGSLTSSGRKRYLTNKQVSDVQSVFSKSKYNEDVSEKVFNITNADKKAIDDARAELQKNLDVQKEVTKLQSGLFKDLENNKDVETYYSAVSEIASFGEGYYRDTENLTLEDVCNASWMGLFEDGGQGGINPYSMYAYKTGIEQEVNDLHERSLNSDKRAREAAESIVQTALNDVGGESLYAFRNNNHVTAAKELVWQLRNSEYDKWEDTKGAFLLERADYANHFLIKHKNSIEIAEKIASHIKNNKDPNTWDLLNQAVENLGLSNEKAYDLSQSDWDKINAEIARLR